MSGHRFLKLSYFSQCEHSRHNNKQISATWANKPIKHTEKSDRTGECERESDETMRKTEIKGQRQRNRYTERIRQLEQTSFWQMFVAVVSLNLHFGCELKFPCQIHRNVPRSGHERVPFCHFLHCHERLTGGTEPDHWPTTDSMTTPTVI